MTLPLEQSMEREMTELTLTIDPNGLWRKQRFEFCNALEAAADRPGDPQPLSVLEGMGLVKQPLSPASLAAIIERVEAAQYAFERVPAAWNAFVKLRSDLLGLTASQSPNGEARSSVGKGAGE